MVGDVVEIGSKSDVICEVGFKIEPEFVGEKLVIITFDFCPHVLGFEVAEDVHFLLSGQGTAD
jgi:predicted nucleic acid-binding Zn finger protein